MSTYDNKAAEDMLLHRLFREVLAGVEALAADLRAHPLGTVQQCDRTTCKTTRVRSVRDGEPQWVYVYPLPAANADFPPTPDFCLTSATPHRWHRLKPMTGAF